MESAERVKKLEKDLSKAEQEKFDKDKEIESWKAEVKKEKSDREDLKAKIKVTIFEITLAS